MTPFQIKLPDGKTLLLQQNILDVAKILLEEAKKLKNPNDPEDGFLTDSLPLGLKFSRSRKPNKQGKYVVKVLIIPPKIEEAKVLRNAPVVGEIILDTPLSHSMYVDAGLDDLDAIEEGKKSKEDCEPCLYVLQHEDDKEYLGGKRRLRDVDLVKKISDLHGVKLAHLLGSVKNIEAKLAIISETPKKVAVYKRSKNTAAFNDFMTYHGKDLFYYCFESKTEPGKLLNFGILLCEYFQREYTKNSDVFFNDIKLENFSYSETEDKVYNIDKKARVHHYWFTPEYLAPWVDVQRVNNTMNYSPSKARDIYALGHLIVELSKGIAQLPFEKVFLFCVGRNMKSQASAMNRSDSTINDVVTANTIIKNSLDFLEFFKKKSITTYQKRAFDFYLRLSENALHVGREFLEERFFSEVNQDKNAVLLCAILGAKEYIYKHKNHGEGKIAVGALVINIVEKIDINLPLSEYQQKINEEIKACICKSTYKNRVIPASGNKEDSRKIIFKKYEVNESDDREKIDKKLILIELNDELTKYVKSKKNNKIFDIIKLIVPPDSLKSRVIQASLDYLGSDEAGSIGKKAVSQMMLELINMTSPVVNEQKNSVDVENEVSLSELSEKEKIKNIVQTSYRLKGCWAATFNKKGKREAFLDGFFEERSNAPRNRV